MRFVAAGCFSVAVLAAGPDRAAAQSAHFDSLANAELAKPHPYSARFERLGLIAVALAGGAEPGHVAMSIAGRPMSFQIVGIRRTRIYAVGWHDVAADTMITILAPHVMQFRGSTVDTGTANVQAFNMSATVGDTNCVSLYRLVHVPQRCNVGHATMSFATLSTGGTLIASPEVTFGVLHIGRPLVAPLDP